MDSATKPPIYLALAMRRSFLSGTATAARSCGRTLSDNYVDSREYGVDGRSTNNSRVTMLTGLSRREVARVRDCILDEDASPVSRDGNRMA